MPKQIFDHLFFSAVAASLGRVISTIKSLTDTDSTYVIAEIALWTYVALRTK